MILAFEGMTRATLDHCFGHALKLACHGVFSSGRRTRWTAGTRLNHDENKFRSGDETKQNQRLAGVAQW
jgi:hypothetical protein